MNEVEYSWNRYIFNKLEGKKKVRTPHATVTRRIFNGEIVLGKDSMLKLTSEIEINNSFCMLKFHTAGNCFFFSFSFFLVSCSSYINQII